MKRLDSVVCNRRVFERIVSRRCTVFCLASAARVISAAIGRSEGSIRQQLIKWYNGEARVTNAARLLEPLGASIKEIHECTTTDNDHEPCDLKDYDDALHIVADWDGYSLQPNGIKGSPYAAVLAAADCMSSDKRMRMIVLASAAALKEGEHAVRRFAITDKFSEMVEFAERDTSTLANVASNCAGKVFAKLAHNPVTKELDPYYVDRSIELLAQCQDHIATEKFLLPNVFSDMDGGWAMNIDPLTSRIPKRNRLLTFMAQQAAVAAHARHDRSKVAKYLALSERYINENGITAFRSDPLSQRAVHTPLALVSIAALRQHFGLQASERHKTALTAELNRGRELLRRSCDSKRISPFAVTCLSTAMDVIDFVTDSGLNLKKMNVALQSIYHAVKEIGAHRCGFFWRDPFYCLGFSKSPDFTSELKKIMNGKTTSTTKS